MLENTCPPAPYFPHATIDSYSVQGKQIVDITCNIGYRFSGGVKTMQIQCDHQTGGWDYDVLDTCTSK